MEYKGHTHVKFYELHPTYNSWQITPPTIVPYRFRVQAYLTTPEFNELSDQDKIQCNEIREVDFPIIDQLIADDDFWETYYRLNSRLPTGSKFTDVLKITR